MKRPEQELQNAVADYLFMLEKHNGFLWFAVPNGGHRSKIEAAIFKGQGVRAGIPDICIIKGGKSYFIELKSAKGRMSPAQEHIKEMLEMVGSPVLVCRSLDEVKWCLQHWGII